MGMKLGLLYYRITYIEGLCEQGAAQNIWT